jgi:thymidine phosphorylase
LTRVLPVGSKVRAGDPLLRVHAASASDADAALATLAQALPITDGPALPDPPVVRGVVGRPGRHG